MTKSYHFNEIQTNLMHDLRQNTDDKVGIAMYAFKTNQDIVVPSKEESYAIELYYFDNNVYAKYVGEEESPIRLLTDIINLDFQGEEVYINVYED